MCNSWMMKTGRVPIVFASAWLSRESLALACSVCSCVLEVNQHNSKLMEFHGLRLAHLQQPWPGLRFVDYSPLTPRGVSYLYAGES